MYYLAAQNARGASSVFQALLASRITRILRHYIIEDALPLGRIRPAIAAAVDEIIEIHWQAKLPYLLQRTGYMRDKKTSTNETRQPVLGATETIVASCTDSGYLTLATTDNAAKRMFADRVPLRTLRRQVTEVPRPLAITDLTLIHGKSLSWLEGGEPSGAREGRMLESGSADSSRLQSIQDEVALSTLQEMAAAMHLLEPDLLADEALVIADATAAARRVTNAIRLRPSGGR